MVGGTRTRTRTRWIVRTVVVVVGVTILTTVRVVVGVTVPPIPPVDEDPDPWANVPDEDLPERSLWIFSDPGGLVRNSLDIDDDFALAYLLRSHDNDNYNDNDDDNDNPNDPPLPVVVGIIADYGNVAMELAYQDAQSLVRRLFPKSTSTAPGGNGRPPPRVFRGTSCPFTCSPVACRRPPPGTGPGQALLEYAERVARANANANANANATNDNNNGNGNNNNHHPPKRVVVAVLGPAATFAAVASEVAATGVVEAIHLVYGSSRPLEERNLVEEVVGGLYYHSYPDSLRTVLALEGVKKVLYTAQSTTEVASYDRSVLERTEARCCPSSQHSKHKHKDNKSLPLSLPLPSFACRYLPMMHTELDQSRTARLRTIFGHSHPQDSQTTGTRGYLFDMAVVVGILYPHWFRNVTVAHMKEISSPVYDWTILGEEETTSTSSSSCSVVTAKNTVLLPHNMDGERFRAYFEERICQITVSAEEPTQWIPPDHPHPHHHHNHHHKRGRKLLQKLISDFALFLLWRSLFSVYLRLPAVWMVYLRWDMLLLICLILFVVPFLLVASKLSKILYRYSRMLKLK